MKSWQSYFLKVIIGKNFVITWAVSSCHVFHISVCSLVFVVSDTSAWPGCSYIVSCHEYLVEFCTGQNFVPVPFPQTHPRPRKHRFCPHPIPANFFPFPPVPSNIFPVPTPSPKKIGNLRLDGDSHHRLLVATETGHIDQFLRESSWHCTTPRAFLAVHSIARFPF